MEAEAVLKDCELNILDKSMFDESVGFLNSNK